MIPSSSCPCWVKPRPSAAPVSRNFVMAVEKDGILGSRLNHFCSLSGVGGPGYVSSYSMGFMIVPAVSGDV